MADFERCCKILGIKHDAGPDEIKQAYRDLVKIWHPDRFAGDIRLQKKAHEQLKNIISAYRNLVDNNAGHCQTGGEPDNTRSTMRTVEHRRVDRRFSIIRRTAICLFILACFGFFLASVRSDVAEIPYNLGTAYLGSGHCDEALKALRIAGFINPGSAKIYYALGNAYYQSTLYAEAEEAYAQAIRINPDHEGAQRRLALLSARRGMHENSGIR
ncbi:MAG: tetratricopeptide repeat protein [Syntrophobacteraceae bacterium]|jgi:tetratricopeptide (TPR) repeat protein